MSSTAFSPAGRAIPRARRVARWSVRLVLALLLLVPVGACAALLASDVAPASSTSSVACPHSGPGHEVICELAPSLAGVAQRKAPRDWWAPAVATALAGLSVGLLAPRAPAWVTDGPRWTRRGAPTGRHLLLSVGITRI